jgi:hypothetical protein
MQTHSRARTLFGLGLLLASLSLLPGRSAAGVYDDTVAWWHFDYDPDADNQADLDEIRDQRAWGTAALKGAGGKHATSLTGQSGSPQWSSGATNGPAGGLNFGNRSMRFSPAVDANNNVWPDTFQVNGLGLAGSATLVTRLRWGGPAASGQANFWLYNNRLEWNAYRGWLFGFMTNASGSYLSFYTQKTTSNSDIALATNA